MDVIATVLASKIGAILERTFQTWRAHTLALREIAVQAQKIQTILRIKHILRTTVRGQRSPLEIEEITKFLTTMSCVPKLTPTEYEKMANELDWVAQETASVIFLQGDYGSCFYIIAQGAVDLFLEPSKEKEMHNCRQYGIYRNKPLTEELSDLTKLGKHIATLKAGQGFGELAILSTTHQFRGASAVTTPAPSLLFIIPKDTYNAILRKHHFRQQKLMTAVSYLKSLPLFQFYTPPKLANIAYHMRSQNLTPTTVLWGSGARISSIVLLASGSIKEQVPHSPLTLREIGRGQLLGVLELINHNGMVNHNFIATTNCEVYHIPLLLFQEILAAAKNSFPDRHNPEISTYQMVLEAESQRTSQHTQRIYRASSTIQTITATPLSDDSLRNDLSNVLPLLGIGSSPSSNDKDASSSRKNSGVVLRPPEGSSSSFSSPRKKAGILR